MKRRGRRYLKMFLFPCVGMPSRVGFPHVNINNLTIEGVSAPNESEEIYGFSLSKVPEH